MLRAALFAALLAAHALATTTPLTAWRVRPAAQTEWTATITTPNTLVGGLLGAGHYDFDPFYGMNLKRIDAAAFRGVPWVFQATYTTPAAGAQFLLKIDSLNYNGTLRINGKVVAGPETFTGALNGWELDVTAFLHAGANTVEFTLTGPRDDAHEWRNRHPDLSVSFDDWNPHPPDLSMGLTGDIAVVATPLLVVPGPVATLSGLVVDTQLYPAVGQSTAAAMAQHRAVKAAATGATTLFLNASVVVTNWGPAGNVPVTLVLAGPKGVVFTVTATLAMGGHGAERRAVFSWTEHAAMLQTTATVSLWWPHRMGAQSLYTATVTAAAAQRTWTVGLRQVTKLMTAGGAVQFAVNNRPFQVLGGGFAPDMFLRRNATRLAQELKLMKHMGLNTLRLEGMMMYEDFFAALDRAGILAMPGFGCCDGWQHWDLWTPLEYRVAEQSMRHQARRLGTHPSILSFFEASDTIPPADVEAIYNRVLREEAWPAGVISSASQQPSTITGPSGVKMVGPYSWVPPNYWLVDGSGVNPKMNYGGAWGFLTEGGPGESPMTYNSWQRTVPASKLWDPATKSMDEWWSWHMGCPYGHFRNLTFYSPPLNARLGASADSREYLYRAQVENHESIRSMFESYQRNKHVNATGIIQWQIKAAWPSHLWNLFDWYFVPGGSFYAATKALSEVHPMLSYDDGTVWLLANSWAPHGAVTVDMAVYTLGGKLLMQRGTVLPIVPTDASLLLPELTVPIDGMPGMPKGTTFLVLLQWQLHGSQKKGTNWYHLSTTRDVLGPWADSNSFRTPCAQWADYTQLNTLPKSQLNTTWAVDTAAQSIEVTVAQSAAAKSVAFFIHVRVFDAATGLDVQGVVFDDNFFTLLPGGKATVVASLADIIGTTGPYATPPSRLRVAVETYNDVVAN